MTVKPRCTRTVVFSYRFSSAGRVAVSQMRYKIAGGAENGPKRCREKQKNRMNTRFLSIHAVLWLGAGYGTRTRRLLLGKQSLYRMS